MKILITRPLNAALETAERFTGSEFTPVIAPLTEIEPLIDKFPNFTEAMRQSDCVIFTSARAPEVLLEKNGAFDTDLPILTVGKKTAQAARKAGFHNIIHIAETARALCEAYSETAFKTPLYGAGLDRKPDLENGITATTVPLYAARAVAELPEAARQAIENEELRDITLFSQRTGAIFKRLILKNGISPAKYSKLRLYCVGAGVGLCENEKIFPTPKELYGYFNVPHL